MKTQKETVNRLKSQGFKASLSPIVEGCKLYVLTKIGERIHYVWPSGMTTISTSPWKD